MTLTTTSRPTDLMAALRRLTGDEKHAPAAFSTVDVLWVLYDRVLRVDPARPDDPDRDRFLLSKGHGPAAYCAVLATEGFLPADWLDDLAGPAELDEGSNHEAIAYAGATGLDNLTAIVVDNQSATHGWPGGIASRFAVNGWSTTDVDGRDHDDIARGLLGRSAPRPHVVVARVEPRF